MSTATQQVNPSEIARETIKQMAVRRVPPTPEYYTQIYNEIAGLPAKQSVEDVIAKALQTLPHETSAQINWINRWEKLLKQQDWTGLAQAIHDAMQQTVDAGNKWPVAIRGLLRAWDDRRILDVNKKRDLLERVLINFGADEQLPEKISNMVNSWLSQASPEGTALVDDAPTGQRTSDVPISLSAENQPPSSIEQTQPLSNTIASTSMAMPAVPDNHATTNQHTLPNEVQQFHASYELLQLLLKQSLAFGMIPRLEGYPEQQAEAEKLVEATERAKKLKDWEALAKQLKAFLVRVELIGAREDDIRTDILNLLRLLLNNIGELVADDQWLRGQVAVVQNIISGPLDRAQMQLAEASLKEVIYKQGLIKHSLVDAKNAFKQMVSSFIDRLKAMAETSGDYGEKIEGYAKQLSSTDDIIKINSLVESLMRDTHTMQADIFRARDEILQQRDLAESAQQKIKHLQDELTQLSETVRIDQLTGVLNRRGLVEAFETEIARFNRGGGALCVALLDIDNFKLLNDTHGHQVGDKALRHLADVVKDTVRPTDIVTRLGGEEFVVLLPNTNLEEAVVAMTRLQRNLTKAYFMANNEKLLITFSAGVALYRKDEDETSVLQRADLGMYKAKKAGKNRVMTEIDLVEDPRI